MAQVLKMLLGGLLVYFCFLLFPALVATNIWVSWIVGSLVWQFSSGKPGNNVKGFQGLLITGRT